VFDSNKNFTPAPATGLAPKTVKADDNIIVRMRVQRDF
jgi:hypothetical protein